MGRGKRVGAGRGRVWWGVKERGRGGAEGGFQRAEGTEGVQIRTPSSLPWVIVTSFAQYTLFPRPTPSSSFLSNINVFPPITRS